MSNTATIDLGKIRFNWRGTWSNIETYEPLDAVYHGGSTYVCKQTNLSQTPANGSTYWDLAAEGSYPNQSGMAGRFLQTDGNATSWQPLEASGRLLDVQAFHHSSNNGTWNSRNDNWQSNINFTWNKPAGCNNVLVYCTGGGGGARCNSSNYRNAGGGGGGTAIGWYDVSNVSSVAVSVGYGGHQRYNNANRGYTGGTSTFGSYCTGYGGEGGYTDNPYQGGHGGSASGGFMNLIGGDGRMSHGSNSEGGGGESFWHQAGSDHINNNNHDQNIRVHGYFGSGASYGHYSQNNQNSHRGGSGVVVVYAYS